MSALGTSADLIQKCARQMGRLEAAARNGEVPSLKRRQDDFEVLPIPTDVEHQRKHAVFTPSISLYHITNRATRRAPCCDRPATRRGRPKEPAQSARPRKKPAARARRRRLHQNPYPWPRPSYCRRASRSPWARTASRSASSPVDVGVDGGRRRARSWSRRARSSSWCPPRTGRRRNGQFVGFRARRRTAGGDADGGRARGVAHVRPIRRARRRRRGVRMKDNRGILADVRHRPRGRRRPVHLRELALDLPPRAA